MIQLVLTICSILVGGKCYTDTPIPLQEGTGMIGCIIAGQVEGAKYTEAHPNFYIGKYTCEPFGKYTRL